MSVNTFREDEEQKVVLKKDTIIRLLKYLLDYKKQIAVVLLLMGVTTAISLTNPLLIEQALNVCLPDGDVSGMIKLVIIAVVINVVFIMGVKLRMMIMAKISNGALMKIRDQLYIHIQSLSFKFFDSRPTGKILARIIGDVNSLKAVLNDGVTTLIPDFVMLIAVTAIMIVKDWRLALAALLMMPILLVTIFLIEIISHKRWQAYRKKNSNMTAFVHENISGIKVIQGFNAQSESMKDFNMLLDQYEGSFIKAVAVNDFFGPVVDFTQVLGTMVLYFAAIKLVGITEPEVGTLFAFASYLSMFWSPIRNLANFYNQLITNVSAAERVFEILDTEPEIIDDEGAIELTEMQGSVEFKNVTFSYEDDRATKVLDNVSFKVEPGETIALVGPTGAGKTTIVNLISRFYDIQSGEIFIDGYPIKDIALNSLRSKMGVMTQDNFIFSGTVKDNIRYGKLDATDEEIEAAAKAVGAHDFIIKMEKGYDTELGEQGSLSVGQRQLIAFARTMVSMPSILILDEATSSIDTQTELIVQAGIAAILKDRTSFVIAHRLSTIRNADRIFVIDNNGICESGSHEQLMAKKGQYYALHCASVKAH